MKLSSSGDGVTSCVSNNHCGKAAYMERWPKTDCVPVPKEY